MTEREREKERKREKKREEERRREKKREERKREREKTLNKRKRKERKIISLSSLSFLSFSLLHTYDVNPYKEIIYVQKYISKSYYNILYTF